MLRKLYFRSHSSLCHNRQVWLISDKIRTHADQLGFGLDANTINEGMAEEEGRRISERTKAALAAAKERGVELGRNGKVLAKQNREEALGFAQNISGHFPRLGITTDMKLGRIAKILNDNGIKTRNGGVWHKSTVSRLLKRENHYW